MDGWFVLRRLQVLSHFSFERSVHVPSFYSYSIANINGNALVPYTTVLERDNTGTYTYTYTDIDLVSQEVSASDAHADSTRIESYRW